MRDFTFGKHARARYLGSRLSARNIRTRELSFSALNSVRFGLLLLKRPPLRSPRPKGVSGDTQPDAHLGVLNSVCTGSRVQKAPPTKRDQGWYRVEPHPEGPFHLRLHSPQPDQRADLPDKLDEYSGREEGLDDILELKKAERNGEPADEQQRHVGKILGRMKPREHAKEVSILCRRVRDARVTQQQREAGAERRPQHQGGEHLRDAPAVELLDKH